MVALRHSVAVLGFQLAGTLACSGASSSPPPSINPAQNSASGGAAGQDAASSQQTPDSASTQASLFGTSGTASTPSQIRGQQKTQLDTQRSYLLAEISTDLQVLSQLQSTQNNVQLKILPNPAVGTPAGDLLTAVGAGAVGAIGSMSGGAGGVSSSGLGGAGGIGGVGGMSSGMMGASAYGIAANALGQAVSSAIVTQQTAADVTAINGGVQQQVDQLNAQIKNLYAQLAAINTQINGLIAQGDQ